MKLKSKLILAAASLMVLSGAAAGTSAFAWFTANTAATATLNGTGVANVDQLNIAAAAEAKTATEVTNTTGTGSSNTVANQTFVAIAGKSNALTDVSSQGNIFYKQSSTGTYYAVNTAETNYPLPYYYQFAVTFSHTNTTKSMAIFLSHTSSITSNHASQLVDIKNVARVAILDGDNLVAFYAPNRDLKTNNTYRKYLGLNESSAIAEKEIYTDATTNVCATGYKMNVLDSSYTTDVTDVSTGVTANQPGYLCTLTGTGTTATKTLTVRIWLEGEDPDCINTDATHSVLTQALTANLVFNGINSIKTA